MKIYVCMIPGDDILIAGASFDKRICYNKYWERKSALEEKYHLAVTHTPDECVHEVEIEGSTCLHLCIAGHYSDKEVVGAVIGDEDMHSMMGMMDRLNHQANDEDYFHMEDIMLGLPESNQRQLDKYTVYLYRPNKTASRSRWNIFYPKTQEEYDKLFEPKIELITGYDTDEFWNFGAPPRIEPIVHLDEIVMPDGSRMYREEHRVYVYASDKDHALKIASDTLATHLARKDDIA